MVALSARNDIEFQLATEIRELGLMMVRFDTWCQEANERHDWETRGEFEVRRLAVQFRRSNLMAEAFAWRRKERA